VLETPIGRRASIAVHRRRGKCCDFVFPGGTYSPVQVHRGPPGLFSLAETTSADRLPVLMRQVLPCLIGCWGDKYALFADEFARWGYRCPVQPVLECENHSPRFFASTHTKKATTMSNGTQIEKGDIVEHKVTGQTWRVMSNVDGTLRVKGNGMSTTLLLGEVEKAPPRPR
jgi:hypothetical protein